MLKNSFNRYLRSTIVLAIDTITSVIASLLVLLFCYVFTIEDISLAYLLTDRFVATWLIGATVGSLVAFYLTGVYKLVIRFSTLRELSKVCMSVLIKEMILAFAIGVFADTITVRLMLAFLVLDFLITIGGLLLTRVTMLTVYWLSNRKNLENADMNRVLVYGIDDKSVSILTHLRSSDTYDVKGFLTHGVSGSERKLIMGKPIVKFDNVNDIMRLKTKYNLSGVLFAHRRDLREEQNRLMNFCQEVGLKMYIAPSIDELKDGKINSGSIRKIKIEDLLGRSEIQINMKEIRNTFHGKTILVTGAAGSIGSELCRQLAGLGVKHLVMFDNAETPLHNVRLEFEEKYPGLYFTPVMGDVRLERRLDFVFRQYRPDIVFHAAAYKHVPLMEENPCEAVMANVRGSRNVADKCVEYNVEKMVMVSTDKAVNPTNIMGCTKRLAEIYVQSLGLAIERGEIEGRTTFITTRFGNVLGSNGSVIPRFQEQIEKGGPVTVTDPEIRRFFMTIPEACRLVMEAATMATGTEIFVFDMGTPIKISDLAKRMISLAGFEEGVDIQIKYTGLRPGEKLYEEVLATKENTLPTDNARIFKARVREYPYSDAADVASTLDEFAREVRIDEMVIKMKEFVPEFISKHSVFEKFDKKPADTPASAD
ncbi:MAG: polysaccharide biosynthesis protein [Muribaculaceae bacterium]|nr:polysaccharide biosynthesis protein [Muribaculaceae bacterium]